MDRAVLDAYAWTDIPTDCEFLLDYEIDEEQWGTRKKPYRYRWPDEVRDEVLARASLSSTPSERLRRSVPDAPSARTTAARVHADPPDIQSARYRQPPPVPRTLWDDNPVDGDDAGGNPDGTEAQAP